MLIRLLHLKHLTTVKYVKVTGYCQPTIYNNEIMFYKEIELEKYSNKFQSLMLVFLIFAVFSIVLRFTTTKTTA